jgi:hypothetical protein
MKSKILLIGILLLTTTSIIAGEEKSDNTVEAKAITCALSGIVLDKSTGEPLTGVEVGLEGTELKVYTDFEGSYSFENLTPGEYIISASLISYKSNGTKSIKINGNKVHQNLELETAF